MKKLYYLDESVFYEDEEVLQEISASALQSLAKAARSAGRYISNKSLQGAARTASMASTAKGAIKPLAKKAGSKTLDAGKYTAGKALDAGKYTIGMGKPLKNARGNSIGRSGLPQTIWNHKSSKWVKYPAIVAGAAGVEKIIPDTLYSAYETDKNGNYILDANGNRIKKSSGPGHVFDAARTGVGVIDSAGKLVQAGTSGALNVAGKLGQGSEIVQNTAIPATQSAMSKGADVAKNIASGAVNTARNVKNTVANAVDDVRNLPTSTKVGTGLVAGAGAIIAGTILNNIFKKKEWLNRGCDSLPENKQLKCKKYVIKTTISNLKHSLSRCKYSNDVAKCHDQMTAAIDAQLNDLSKLG